MKTSILHLLKIPNDEFSKEDAYRLQKALTERRCSWKQERILTCIVIFCFSIHIMQIMTASNIQFWVSNAMDSFPFVAIFEHYTETSSEEDDRSMGDLQQDITRAIYSSSEYPTIIDIYIQSAENAIYENKDWSASEADVEEHINQFESDVKKSAGLHYSDTSEIYKARKTEKYESFRRRFDEEAERQYRAVEEKCPWAVKAQRWFSWSGTSIFLTCIALGMAGILIRKTCILSRKKMIIRTCLGIMILCSSTTIVIDWWYQSVILEQSYTYNLYCVLRYWGVAFVGMICYIACSLIEKKAIKKLQEKM